MKRGTPSHPKTLALQDALGLESWGVVGVLEALWHWTASYAPRGDIGRFSNKAIAAGIGWKGDPDFLIASLAGCGWVEGCCERHRLRVHDWPDHADNGVRSKIGPGGWLECYGTPSPTLPINVKSSGFNLETSGLKDETSGLLIGNSETSPGSGYGSGYGSGSGKEKSAEPSEPPLSDLFVQVFNAAFHRRVGPSPEIARRISARQHSGYKPWQILALPILSASWADDSWRKAATPAILLRDGKHPRTTRDGYTTGATDHLERELQRLDQARLDARLTALAEEAGVLEPLQKMGATVTLPPQEQSA